MSIDIELESISPTKEWLEGLVDLHMYHLPCVFDRMFTSLELAKQCRAAGYRAIVLKNHFYPNIEGAYLASKEVPGIEVYGSVVLNWQVGGLNPFAVDAAITLGAKTIWMGNMHATTESPHGIQSTKPFRSHYGWGTAVASDSSWVKRPTKKWMVAPPTNVIDLETAELLPAVHDIIELIAEADIILATCHISKRECFAIVPAATKAGANNIVITHPSMDPKETKRYWEIEELKKITDMGAILEHAAADYNWNDPEGFERLVKTIRAVGADKCVLTSSSGALQLIHPIEKMRNFILNLRRRGIGEKEVEIMTKKNPAKLLGLE